MSRQGSQDQEEHRQRDTKEDEGASSAHPSIRPVAPASHDGLDDDAFDRAGVGKVADNERVSREFADEEAHDRVIEAVIHAVAKLAEAVPHLLSKAGRWLHRHLLTASLRPGRRECIRNFTGTALRTMADSF